MAMMAFPLSMSFGLAQNLVPNPSFETYTACPTSAAQIVNCTPWFIPAGHGGSPDFHHVCGNTTFGVPSNIFGNQMPRTGSGYAGFSAGGLGTLREYMQVQLTSALVAGMTYDVEAYVSLSDGSGLGVDGYQFYFSNAPLTGTGSTAIPVTPQVAQPVCNNITNQTNWVLVSGSFVASGGEQYMTVGNFDPDAATCTSTVTGWSWNYSYMDDISVTAAVVFSAEGLELFGNWDEKGNALLKWSTVSETETDRFELERSHGDLEKFEFVAEVNAAGNSLHPQYYQFFDVNAASDQRNFYRIKLIDKNGGVGYSNTLELKSDPGNAFRAALYPNVVSDGGTSTFEMILNSAETVEVGLWDRLGREVRKWKFSGHTGMNLFEIPVTGLEAGYYFLKYRMNTVSGTEKLIIQK